MQHPIPRVCSFRIVDDYVLVWPNGADFDPARLHDWPDRVDALAALARTWEPQSA